MFMFYACSSFSVMALYLVKNGKSNPLCFLFLGNFHLIHKNRQTNKKKKREKAFGFHLPSDSMAVMIMLFRKVCSQTLDFDDLMFYYKSHALKEKSYFLLY